MCRIRSAVSGRIPDAVTNPLRVCQIRTGVVSCALVTIAARYTLTSEFGQLLRPSGLRQRWLSPSGIEFAPQQLLVARGHLTPQGITMKAGRNKAR